jgi:hypothetical protein
MSTVKEEPTTRIQQGMLILDPGDGIGTPTVWTVLSSGEAPKTLIAHYGSCSCKSTLNKSGLPKGWKIINNRVLADLLLKEPGG